MHPQVTTVTSSRTPYRRHRRREPRSYHSLTLAEWTSENVLYEVEFTHDRGRVIALRREDAWFNEQGVRVGLSEDILAVYFPSQHK